MEAKDLQLVYSAEGIDQPSVILQQSDKYPDEVAALVSFIPKMTPTHDEDTKEDSDEDEEMAPGEFIFVLDRSGSMSGNRIELAKQAVELFLQSLPEGSRFNVVSFGSGYDLMFSESSEYTEKTKAKAL